MTKQVNPGDRVRVGGTDLSVLFSEAQIQARVRAMGLELREELGQRNPVFVGLLAGGAVFLSDLIRGFPAAHEVDFLQVSRYQSQAREASDLRVLHDLRSNIHRRTVVLVEGIRARGTKIQYVDSLLRLHQPAEIRYVAMVQPSDAQMEVPLHLAGFAIDKEYVVGYGLDWNERHRNLPFLGALAGVA